MSKRYLFHQQASVLGLAIQYTRNHWLAFNTYMEEGWLNIDNNLSERKMKIIAKALRKQPTRKNGINFNKD